MDSTFRRNHKPIFLAAASGPGRFDHHAIFVEISKEKKTGHLFQVHGDSLTFQSLQHLHHPRHAPDLLWMQQIGWVKDDNLFCFRAVCSATPTLLPDMPFRNSQHWTADSIRALRAEGILLPLREHDNGAVVFAAELEKGDPSKIGMEEVKMPTRHSLPYYAPAKSLPAPLPTVDQIMASTQIIWSIDDKTIRRVGKHFVVKHGPGVTLQEGENMLFVREASNVPVPTVYALFHDEKTGNNFIVQEYIAGWSLVNVWSSLDHDGKEMIATQLRAHLDDLRSIPSPGYFGGVWRQPIRDYLQTAFGTLQPPGAVELEEDWVALMVRATRHIPDNMHFDKGWMRYVYNQVFRGHRAVFTHGDLRQNIIVRDDMSLVIIDWEYAGWYPSFWEYSVICRAAPANDDWRQWVHCFLDEHMAELGWMLKHFDCILAGR